jgi:hypothetical protein
MQSQVVRQIARCFGASLALVLVSACADSSLVSPKSSRATAELGNPDTKYVLTRTTPLTKEYSVTAWIYPSNSAYQSVKIQEAGLKVSFPPGAVTQKLQVTLIAHAGNFVSYEFYPHGTTFLQPVKIQQDLHGTSAYHNDVIMANLLGGYLANGWDDIDQSTGTATLAESFSVFYWDDTDSFKKTTPSVVKFYTNHFSGYILASGIRTTTSYGQ